MKEAYDLSSQETGYRSKASLVDGTSSRQADQSYREKIGVGVRRREERGREGFFQAQTSGIDLAGLSIRFSLPRWSLKQ